MMCMHLYLLHEEAIIIHIDLLLGQYVPYTLKLKIFVDFVGLRTATKF